MRALLAIFLIAACGPDDPGRGSTSSTGASSGNGGHHDLGFDQGMSIDDDLAGYTGKPDACAAVSAMANLKKRPIDIIFVIDDSGSMSEEITAVQNNINRNFAAIIGASGLDYRVIMLSNYSAQSFDGSYYRVCVLGPLGGNTNCDVEPWPIGTTRYDQYDDIIDSNDSFERILATYNTADPSCASNPSACTAPHGWSDWLRPDALKVFIEITDDESNTPSDVFETMLFALTPKMFGDETNRNYIWHSIVGMKENTPPTKAYAPTDPLVTMACSTAKAAGHQYQNLSILTGGLRFPICQYANFDVVFQAVAAGVVSGSKVACNFDVPPAPGGQVVDLSSVRVNYTPSNGGSVQALSPVPTVSSCTASSFYIASDVDAGVDQIVLCPDACTLVQTDNSAQIAVTFDCSVT